MKKLLSTAAIVAALSTPAFADVTIGGDFVWSHQNNASAKSTAVDADLNIKTSTTTDTGLTFGADFNLNQDGNDDGSNSLTVSNDMFALDLGDTNSALDVIDDATDW